MGILHGKGRAVFDGHIIVDRDAQQSDAQLSNDNLMLTRSAEVDTKPQLEIYADDVKAATAPRLERSTRAAFLSAFARHRQGESVNHAQPRFAAGISSEIRLAALRRKLTDG